MEDIQEEVQIYVTKDYARFSLSPTNRDICAKHVTRLVRSISERNLLSFNPIIVDKDLCVIDGQHRLKAAEILQIPIYYRIISNASNDCARLMSSNSKTWTLLDTLKYYSQIGAEAYVQWKQLVDDHPLLKTTVLAIACVNSQDRVVFREGRVNPPEMAEVTYILNGIEAVRSKLRDLNTRFSENDLRFMISIFKRLRSEGFREEDVKKRIRNIVPEMVLYRDSVKIYEVLHG